MSNVILFNTAKKEQNCSFCGASIKAEARVLTSLSGGKHLCAKCMVKCARLIHEHKAQPT